MRTSIYLPSVDSTRLILNKRFRLYEHEVLRLLTAHGMSGSSTVTMCFRQAMMDLRGIVELADAFLLKMQAQHIEFALVSWLDRWLQTVGESQGNEIGDLQTLMDQLIAEVRFRLNQQAAQATQQNDQAEELAEA